MLTLELSDRVCTTDRPAFVMGIINADKDSFWEKSRGGYRLALKMIKEGADILDIGAESTRPGAVYKSAGEEIKALVPLIKKIRSFSNIPISVDTRKLQVMQACYSAGADILNDISSLEDDSELAAFCSEKKIPVILMHKRGNSVTMDKECDYNSVCAEVKDYLLSRAQFAEKQGISPNKIILDPGFGFAKDYKGNIELLKRINELCSAGYPVLAGLSRKRIIGDLTGCDVSQRLAGTLAANIWCTLKGVKFLRVHDVKQTVDAMNVLKGICYAGN